MSRRIVLALLSASLPWLAPLSALSQDFGPWRTLTVEEEKARIAGISPESVDPSLIEADFDGNGKKDKALIAIRKADKARGLIVVLNGQLQVLALFRERVPWLDDDESGLRDTGLQIAEPGSWQPNCYDDVCFKHPPKKRILKNPGILLLEDLTTMLYFWDPKTKSFGASLMVH
jgi:hypothetical protein